MFAALHHRNYRWFFISQVISFSGTWMQTLAEGWLVYQITQSTIALGVIRFLHTLPVTLFTFGAGMIADRIPKRKILLCTQSVSLLLAFTLFLLTWHGSIQVWMIGVIAFGLGTCHAFDIPTRQSFIVEMVGKRDLMNAIALNSSVFNASRIIGPALAGVIIAAWGAGTCFLLNSLSFLAVILAYARMQLPPSTAPQKSGLRAAMKEALHFAWHHPTLRLILPLISATSLFVMPYATFMPVYAQDVLKLSSAGFGGLMAANGIGAFLGALSLAWIGHHWDKMTLLKFSAPCFYLAIFIFGLSTHLWLSVTALVLAGWNMIYFFSTANTLIQINTPDPLRGRIMGLYSFCFIGVSPFGNLLMASLANHSSVSFTTLIGCGLTFLFSLFSLAGLRLRPAENSDQQN